MGEIGAKAQTGGEVTVHEKKHDKKHGEQPSFDLDELQSLAELVNEHGFTDCEFENENYRVRFSKQVTVAAAPVQMAAPAAVSTPPAHSPSAAETGAAVSDEDAGLEKIVSPIVGTFYRSPGPDKPPYVAEGDKVSPESVVCIVEAMKLMNEIQAEMSGEVVKIYVDNGQPVEYGQPLFGIRK